MKIYVSANAGSKGDGSKENPFKRISDAAKAAVPGDEVSVAPGIYREHVSPPLGGTSDENRITYASEVQGAAIISGAERVEAWEKYESTVWVAHIPNEIFEDYNPYTSLVGGDWFYPINPVHTGEVYLNGKAMYEAPQLNAVTEPSIYSPSWDHDFTIYKWYAEQKDGKTVIYANFHGADPNKENVEINARKYCFFPKQTGINYITVSGFSIMQAATQWAPPTAYQEGMIGPHWAKGWIIEDCEISNSRCSGISIGKYLQPENENKWTTKKYKNGTQTERDAICQALTEGWTKENIGSHIIRRCDIHDCGQTGIVGHLGGVFSIIEDNHIHHINTKQELYGAEIAGIKMHAAIDVTLRRNHIHHCARGLWLDWQAQGTRVSQNLFHDNTPPAGSGGWSALSLGEDIFVEVSHGPTLIDNNIFLTQFSARISTQGVAFVHNLIAGSFTYVGEGTNNNAVNFPAERYTPYHVPHRTEIAGFMTFLHGDMRFYNNIFVQQPIRPDLQAMADMLAAANSSILKMPNLTCGTQPYDGYPTGEAYFKKFHEQHDLAAVLASGDIQKAAFEVFNSDKYYDHLPVYTGGNVYFNGAKPCDAEENYVENTNDKVYLELQISDGKYTLSTNLYEYVACLNTPFISTETLGEAFEPEQKFENPDGTPISFNQDYFGGQRAAGLLPGPFKSKDSAQLALV